ncbi:MAG: RNA polymerase sigma-54 factor [Hyphomicrobiaceae bacterium TMED74]|nr:RNA polymerase sigma-54 factor [Filomicrobium sp.]RPG38886.1 MAG: RNA polymerase sigma-54 factor [Hyphomicrobiaceae bacterium TMED74]
MAFSAKLEMRQGQQLVMTPQLQQAIKLLQLSNLELTAFVDAELERNPLLERDGLESPTNGSDGKDASEEAPAREDSTGADDDEWLDLKDTSASSTDLDTDYSNVYADMSTSEFTPDLGGSNWSNVSSKAPPPDGDSNLEAYVSDAKSLKDHLIEHLQITISDPVDQIIGRYIIDMVDESGYIVGEFADLGAKLAIDQSRIEQVLELLQTCDPPGIPARDLAECLRLQLKEQNRFDPIIAKLIDNLHLLASHNIPQLKRAVGVSQEELTDMILELKGLDPKPGLQFGFTPIQPVVPDVMVRPARDGSWIVELNNDTLPRVLVDRTYYATVSKGARSGGEKDYLQDCLQTANWLVKSLDQRARTILRVSEEIVRQQDGFFSHGVQYLKPLNLKTVADAISMHESTISRVTSNKYMATPRGILELKYFFSSAIASASDGESHSSEAVRHRIKCLIDGETAGSVLSDDKIVDRLKSDGIDIARRTVAKYREAMRIPSSVQRRRELKLSQSVQ